MGSLVTKLTSIAAVSGCIALLVGQVTAENAHHAHHANPANHANPTNPTQLLGLCAVLLLAYPVLPRKQYCRLAHWFQNRFLTTFVYLIERNHESMKLYFSGDALPPGVRPLCSLPFDLCFSAL